ncbi:unnamed protein product [Parnassius apollo]|uniref:(apollo) hypothetical protein n=1 Tax=Parnassius apollo TaxID=110799 RepID=A0A8S3X3H6_PARAO|nr:unnamed protein product [Parnassius apollo]
MSDKRCCVPGCKDSKGKLVLHRFPNPEKESERLRVITLNVRYIDYTQKWKEIHLTKKILSHCIIKYGIPSR